MKRVAILIILALVMSPLFGCQKTEETPDYRQEILSLGFKDAREPNWAKDYQPSIIYEAMVEVGSDPITLIRASDGSWFWNENWEKDIKVVNRWCEDFQVAIRFEGWLSGYSVPTFEVMAYNNKHATFRSWDNTRNNGLLGRGYYAMSRSGAGDWIPANQPISPQDGFIDQISLEKLKSEAERFFYETVQDPHGKGYHYRDYPYKEVWDYARGGLRE